MAGSRAMRVPNAVAVMWRSASSSNAKGRTGSRIASPAVASQDTEGEVAGGLRDADDRRRDGGDGDGE